MGSRFGFAVAVMLALICAGASPAAAELKVVVTIKPIHSLVTQLMEGIGEPTLLVDVECSAHVSDVQRQQHPADKLVDERLGRCDRDLRPGLHVQDAVRLQ